MLVIPHSIKTTSLKYNKFIGRKKDAHTTKDWDKKFITIQIINDRLDVYDSSAHLQLLGIGRTATLSPLLHSPVHEWLNKITILHRIYIAKLVTWLH